MIWHLGLQDYKTVQTWLRFRLWFRLRLICRAHRIHHKVVVLAFCASGHRLHHWDTMGALVPPVPALRVANDATSGDGVANRRRARAAAAQVFAISQRLSISA